MKKNCLKMGKTVVSMFLCLIMILGCLFFSTENLFAQENDEIVQLAITYHLNSEEGNMIAEPYYASMEVGSNYQVDSPEIENYVLQDKSQKTIEGELNEDTEIHVVYKYDDSYEVSYKINYIGVDSNGKQVTLESVNEKAPVNSLISIPFKDFEGYEKRGGQNMQLTVTDDGKAEKNIYYDKVGKTYIIFQTQGSYVEPIIANAGDDISDQIKDVIEPSRMGYEFVGWDQEIPSIMPDEDLIINAKWIAGESQYTVLKWFENADDENYTLGKNSEVRKAIVGTEVEASIQDIENGNNNDNDVNNSYFGFDYSHCEKVVVEPNGTSVLNVYYKREIWKINYMEEDNKTIWKTIEGKYHSLIGDKIIDDETLKEHYGSNFAYMAKTKNGNDAAMLERFENSKSGTDKYGEQNIFPYHSSSIYKYTIRQYCDDPNTQEELLINTSYIYYYRSYAYGMILIPPAGFVWDGGMWKTSTSEAGLENARLKQNPYGTGSDGKATFYNVYPYMNIYMSRVKSTLNYVSNGEIVQKIQNVPYQKQLDLSLVPTNGKEHMKFAGWYYNPVLMNTEDPLTSYTMPADDLTLYAKWVPVDMTVEFDSQGGSPVDSQTVPYNSKAVMPENPVKEGYEFSGWYTDPKDGDIWSFDQPIENDTILYAHWRPVLETKYTVRHVMQGSQEAFYEETLDGGVGDTVVALPLDPKNENYPSDVYLKADETSKTQVLKVNKDENIITFTYIEVAKKEYAVKYLNKVTNEPISESKSVVTRNTIVTEDAQNFDNYKLVSESRVTQNVKQDGEIVFYYIPTNLTVSYEFKSQTKDTELPQEIIDLTPVDDYLYEYGDQVQIIQPEKNLVTEQNGQWVFKGYEVKDAEFTIENSMKIVGYWEYQNKDDITSTVTVVDNNSNNNLRTGDQTNVMYYFVMMAISFVVMIFISIKLYIKHKH